MIDGRVPLDLPPQLGEKLTRLPDASRVASVSSSAQRRAFFTRSFTSGASLTAGSGSAALGYVTSRYVMPERAPGPVSNPSSSRRNDAGS
jgi:hypothetical protein